MAGLETLRKYRIDFLGFCFSTFLSGGKLVAFKTNTECYKICIARRALIVILMIIFFFIRKKVKKKQLLVFRPQRSVVKLSTD